LVASECDLVCLPEPGWLMLTGLRSEIVFFKELLEKLGIKADFLQMGIYKFTAEPFTRSSMSPEARAQMKLVVDDFFDHSLVGSVSSPRRRAGKKKMTSPPAAQLIDRGPFTARRALTAGLIDQVGYSTDFEAAIKRDLKAGKLKIVRNYAKEKAKEVDLTNP